MNKNICRFCISLLIGISFSAVAMDRLAGAFGQFFRRAGDGASQVLHTGLAAGYGVSLTADETNLFQNEVVPLLDEHARIAHFTDKVDTLTRRAVRARPGLVSLIPAGLAALTIFSALASRTSLSSAMLAAPLVGFLSWLGFREWVLRRFQQAIYANPVTLISRSAMFYFEKGVALKNACRPVPAAVLNYASEYAASFQGQVESQDRLGFEYPKSTASFARRLAQSRV